MGAGLHDRGRIGGVQPDHVHTYPNCNTHSDLDSYCHVNAYVYAHEDPNSHSHCHRHAYTDSDTHSDSHCHAYTDVYTNSDSRSHAYAHARTAVRARGSRLGWKGGYVQPGADSHLPGRPHSTS